MLKIKRTFSAVVLSLTLGNISALFAIPKIEDAAESFSQNRRNDARNNLEAQTVDPQADLEAMRQLTPQVRKENALRFLLNPNVSQQFQEREWSLKQVIVGFNIPTDLWSIYGQNDDNVLVRAVGFLGPDNQEPLAFGIAATDVRGSQYDEVHYEVPNTFLQFTLMSPTQNAN